MLAEALLLGVFGTVLGILIGLPMEWYVLRVVLVEESGFMFDVLFPWKQALGIAADICIYTNHNRTIESLEAVPS